MCHKPVRESYSSDEKTLVSQETLSIRKFKHLDNVYFLVYAGKKSLSTKSGFQFTRPNVQQHPEKRVIEQVICRRVSNDYTRSRTMWFPADHKWDRAERPKSVSPRLSWLNLYVESPKSVCLHNRRGCTTPMHSIDRVGSDTLLGLEQLAVPKGR